MADYRIDELARRTGTRVRNIRAYQDRGLLPAPRREGRVVYYSDQHVERLEHITGLLDRGFTLASIRALIETRSDGLGLDHLIGLGRALTTPFAAEEPRTFSLTELADIFGADADALGGINRSVELGLLRPDEGGFTADDPTVLEAGGRLVRAGVPIGDVMDAFETIRSHLDELATEMVDLVATHVVEPAVFQGDRGPDRLDQAAADALADAVREIRPIAHTVVVAELGHALERAIESRMAQRLEDLTADPGNVRRAR